MREPLLAGRGALYRQTILLSSFASAEMNALMHRTCSNWAGCVKLKSTHQVCSNCTAHGTPVEMLVRLCQRKAQVSPAFDLQQKWLRRPRSGWLEAGLHRAFILLAIDPHKDSYRR